MLENERVKYNLKNSVPKSSLVQPDFFKSMDAAYTAVIVFENMPSIIKHFYNLGIADGQNNFLNRNLQESYNNFLVEVLGFENPE